MGCLVTHLYRTRSRSSLSAGSEKSPGANGANDKKEMGAGAMYFAGIHLLLSKLASASVWQGLENAVIRYDEIH